MFMYKKRGVLPIKNMSTVYTFGAPSVFCESPYEQQVSGTSNGAGNVFQLWEDPLPPWWVII